MLTLRAPIQLAATHVLVILVSLVMVLPVRLMFVLHVIHLLLAQVVHSGVNVWLDTKEQELRAMWTRRFQ